MGLLPVATTPSRRSPWIAQVALRLPILPRPPSASGWPLASAAAKAIRLRPRRISLRLAGLDQPSIAAERLPKALIHRNVPGERIHDLLRQLDAEWARAAAVSPFGPVDRWRTALAGLAASGWPLLDRSRWRLGELTLPWEAVAPAP